MADIIRGLVYVLGDNVYTDQIIPADRLTWNPAIPAERLKLGSYALDGLPDEFKARFPFMTAEERAAIAEGRGKVKYNIIVGGRGFGCGSSREHAPNALGAAGVQAVIAKGYARIFFENSVNTGELLPVTSRLHIVDGFSTGDEAEIDLVRNRARNLTRGLDYDIEPLGYVKAIVEAGGLFAYARQQGLIPPRPST